MEEKHLVGANTIIENGELVDVKPVFAITFKRGEFAYLIDSHAVVIVDGYTLDENLNEAIAYSQIYEDGKYSFKENEYCYNSESSIRRPTQDEIEAFIKAKNPEPSFKSGWFFDNKQLKAVYMVEKTKCIFELDSRQHINDQPFELINPELVPLNEEESEKMDALLKVFGYIIQDNKLVSIWKKGQHLLMEGIGEVILEYETPDGKVFIKTKCLFGNQIGHNGLMSLDADKIIANLRPKAKTFKTKVGNETFELPIELKPLIDKIENIVGND